MTKSFDFIAWTDGACSGNPGPGGWGVVIQPADMVQSEMQEEAGFFPGRGTLFGGEAETTNNRMELTAVVKALEALPAGASLKVVTDSKYVKDGLESWMPKWKRNGWKTAGGDPVKNRDLWEALDARMVGVDLNLEWVKGHAGHPENELADELARRGVEEVRGVKVAEKKDPLGPDVLGEIELYDWQGDADRAEGTPEKIALKIQAYGDKIEVEAPDGRLVAFELESGIFRVLAYNALSDGPVRLDIPAAGDITADTVMFHDEKHPPEPEEGLEP